MLVSAPANPSLYRGHRFPADVIAHAVWLYFRFSLSLRDVEELMAERGVTVTYETIREWCAKFGPTYALQLRRRRPRPSDKWHCKNASAGGGGHDPKWHWLRTLVRMPCPGFVCSSLRVPGSVLPLA